MTKSQVFACMKRYDFKRSGSLFDYELAKRLLCNNCDWIEYSKRARLIAEYLKI